MPSDRSTARQLLMLASIWLPGLLLILAGLSKLLYSSPPPPLVRFLPAEFLGAVWAGEVFLGLWLISGLNRVQALLCGILAFGVLAVVSGWLMLQGTSDCGCLGTLPTHPALMFVLDVVSAASLVMALSFTTSWQDVRHGARQFLMTATVIGVLASAGAGYAVSKYGSLEATARSWRGDVLDLPRFAETNKPGDDGLRRATVPLRNLTNAPIRITGSDACCGARVETILPRMLEAGAEDTLVIVLDCERSRSRVVTVWVESESKLKKQRVVVSCPASE